MWNACVITTVLTVKWILQILKDPQHFLSVIEFTVLLAMDKIPCCSTLSAICIVVRLFHVSHSNGCVVPWFCGINLEKSHYKIWPNNCLDILSLILCISQRFWEWSNIMNMFNFYLNYLKWLLLFEAKNSANTRRKNIPMLRINWLKRHYREKWQRKKRYTRKNKLLSDGLLEIDKSRQVCFLCHTALL